ncbi:hypothetical protein, partial [Streptomyces sp. NPDC003032]
GARQPVPVRGFEREPGCLRAVAIPLDEAEHGRSALFLAVLRPGPFVGVQPQQGVVAVATAAVLFQQTFVQ